MERDNKPKITFVDRPLVAFAETHKKLNQLHQLKQEIDDELSLVVEKVEFKVPFSGPFRIIPISDTHLFSSLTDTRKVEETLGKLNEEKTFGIVMGDFIEGANPNITDHIDTVEIGFGKQIKAARKILEPYINAGKIFSMSTAFNGHEGWGSRYLGIDVVELLADGFTQPDGTPLRVLLNGGRLVIHLSNGETFDELIYHAPGGGGSDEVNPLGAQRNRLWEHISHTGPIGGVGGGDWHHRAGVSKELVFDLMSGKETSHVLFSNGTSKGNDAKRPDTFLTKMAKGPTLAPGVELIINQQDKKRGRTKSSDPVWITYGFNKGEVLYEAAKLWDKTEKQNNTEELLGLITNRSEKPKAVFDRKSSSTKTKENNFDIPAFEKFRWRVESGSNLPILVYLLAHARYGSTSFEKRDREELLEVLKRVESHPFEYSLIMRHFVDSGVASQFNRREILDRMTADLSGVAKQNRLLGLMLSSTLLDPRFLRDAAGDWVEKQYTDKKGKKRILREREIDPGFRPGDEIYKALGRKVPLYLNQSLMQLDFGQANYPFLLMDHLSQSGSEFDPFRGLVQARRKALLPTGLVVAGGHMPGVGYMTTPDADYVATGWFSDYDSGGKANMKRAPLGGQGVIIFPDKKMVIPAATFLEAKDKHAALMLSTGLTHSEKAQLNRRTK